MNWLDIFVFVVIVASFIRGFKTGLIMQAASLLGIILGAIFAGKVAELIYPKLIGIIGNSESVTSVVSYIIAFLLILLAVNIIGRIINKVVKIVLLGTVNKLFGATFCTVKWILIFSILLNLVVMYDQGKSLINEKVRDESHTYPIMIELAQKVIPYLRFDKSVSSEEESPTPAEHQGNQPPQSISV